MSCKVKPLRIKVSTPLSKLNDYSVLTKVEDFIVDTVLDLKNIKCNIEMLLKEMKEHPFQTNQLRNERILRYLTLPVNKMEWEEVSNTKNFYFNQFLVLRNLLEVNANKHPAYKTFSASSVAKNLAREQKEAFCYLRFKNKVEKNPSNRSRTTKAGKSASPTKSEMAIPILVQGLFARSESKFKTTHIGRNNQFIFS